MRLLKIVCSCLFSFNWYTYIKKIIFNELCITERGYLFVFLYNVYVYTLENISEMKKTRLVKFKCLERLVFVLFNNISSVILYCIYR